LAAETAVRHSGKRSVYLDQFVYIRLARAGLGRGPDEDTAHHQRYLAQTLAREVRFPLGVHYLETWRQGNPTRRRELAAEMIRLSRLNTIAPPRTVWRAETSAAVQELFGTPTPTRPVVVWGQGAAHAFGRDPATFWPTELLPAEAAWREMVLLAGAGADSERFAAEQRAVTMSSNASPTPTPLSPSGSPSGRPARTSGVNISGCRPLPTSATTSSPH
jgi:hypothetical protein